MLTKLKLIISSIKKRGFFTTLSFVWNEIIFDIFNKSNTFGVINLNNLKINSDNTINGYSYMPSNKLILDKVFNFIINEIGGGKYIDARLWLR